MFKRALIFSLLFAAGFANAGDPVTDAMQKTYAPYRVALFKTNSNAQDEARRALDQARQGWNELVTRFGAKPPLPYDRDTEFNSSLADVSKTYAKAAEEIDKNQLAAAHETLEHIRDVMAEMRLRNQVVVYSDHMNAYHAQNGAHPHSWEKTLAAPNGLLQLLTQLGALEYLAGNLKSAAPTDYLKNAEFIALYEAVEKSVADLKQALFSQDVTKVKQAIGKIKGPYSKMFIKFG